jgi:hypothetical protein
VFGLVWLKILKALQKLQGELYKKYIYEVTCPNQGLLIDMTFMLFKSGEAVH